MAKTWLFLILLVPFLFYHSNKLSGPDSSVYLAVAHTIVTQGHLNILPDTATPADPYQITHTHHAPIHQNIGAVLFILPATAFSVATHQLATRFSNLSERFYDIMYHEGLWLGCVNYLLAMSSCFLMYRVARYRHSAPPTIVALVSCAIGGPLLPYMTQFPCNAHLPVVFLSSFLLYIYHYHDMKKNVPWMLLGAIWGLGIFIRYEFVVWGGLLCFALIKEKPCQGVWRTVLVRTAWIGAGALLFIAPLFLIRYILFGQFGSTYGIQMDLANVTRLHLMLWGPRNGLFVFWPILLLALGGYLSRFRSNPALYHALFGIVVLVVPICASITFWDGELGISLGQRWFLVVFPCFFLFLSRLMELSGKHFNWFAFCCLICTVWALFLCAAYGSVWNFSNDVKGFLMPNRLSDMIQMLAANYPLFLKQLLFLLIVPKHSDILWLFPVFALLLFGIMKLFTKPRQQIPCSFYLGGMIVLSIVTTGFLADARNRGERAFSEIVSKTGQASFVTRNYDVDFEILGSMVDGIAFSLEQGDLRRVRHLKEKALKFLNKEAPDQITNFKEMCEALDLRRSLEWYRLTPEQNHFSMLEWYRDARTEMQENRPPMNVMVKYLY